MNKKMLKRGMKVLGLIVLLPIALFLLLAILIYIPPVQNYVVDRVAEAMSDSTGLSFSIDRVRLSFPLDLEVHGIEANQRGDSVLSAKTLKADLEFWPLLKGQANVEGLELTDARINTRDLVSNTQVIGVVGSLKASTRGINWKKNSVMVNDAELRDANLTVLLCDTAKKDTTQSAPWLIDVEKAYLKNSTVNVTLPGDTLHVMAHLGKARVEGGHFDTGEPLYTVKMIKLEESALRYDKGEARNRERPDHLPQANGLAAFKNFEALRGLDTDHIGVEALSAEVNDLKYDSRGVLTVDVKKLSAVETGSGFALNDVSGKVHYDSTRVELPALNLRTPYSIINGSINLPFSAFAKGGSPAEGMSIDLDTEIGWQDIRTLGKGFVDDEVLKTLPRQNLILKGNVAGSMQHLTIKDLRAYMPGVARLNGNVVASNIAEDYRQGKANFRFEGQNIGFVNKLLPPGVRQTVRIPSRLSAGGSVAFKASRYEADLNAQIGAGKAKVKGGADLWRETYDADVQLSNFPLASLLPQMPLKPFSGKMKLKGQNFDVLSDKSKLQAEVDVAKFFYDKYDLSGITLKASSSGGKLHASFSAKNSFLEGNGTINATLGNHINAHVKANLPMLDIARLMETPDTMQMGLVGDINVHANRQFTRFGASGYLSDIYVITPTLGLNTEDIAFDFAAAPDTTTAHVQSGDLALNMGLKGEVGHSFGQLAGFASEAWKQIERGKIDEEALKCELPVLSLDFHSGENNPLMRLLSTYDLSFRRADVHIDTNPLIGISGTAHVSDLNKGALMLDTIHANIVTDSTGFQVLAKVHNYKPKNPNRFEAYVKSYLHDAGAGVETEFRDKEGNLGLRLGALASMAEHGIRLKLYPENPVIAYRNFSVNSDNYVFISKDNHLSADLDLLADDGTGLKLYGEPSDSMTDLTLSLSHLNLGELASTVPYVPSISGFLGGDVHLSNKHGQISAMATLQADDFAYQGMKLGNIGVEGIYLPQENGDQYASGYISSEGQEVLACEGTYHQDETFQGAGFLHDFPLAFINSFLAGTDVMLSGIGEGRFNVDGKISAPHINGELRMNDARIYSDVYGFNFRMDEQQVEIQDNQMEFTDYALYSTGQNPLVINGKVDMRQLDKIGVDFKMAAKDFELINAQQNKESMLFGKVFADFDGTLRGNTADGIFIRGNLNVLPQTDATYVLKDSPLSVDSRLDDLVKFVSFNDSVAEKAVVESGMMDLTLGVSISDAAHFLCLLSEDGRSYVDISGGGNLTMRQTRNGDTRLTGRLTVNKGKMKYELPVIPLKTFTIHEGSYIDFTGNMMNPILNIAATERVKSTVTDDGQSRSVAFDVGVAITQTLEDMGLEFTIEAPADLAMQNTLAAMTPAQRGKTAVAMLATGMFISDNAAANGTGLKASNALNAFLQNEIQNIAGNALRTIDVNLGVESGTSSKGTATTDYSFQFAKRFWGDRVSVIIGGKVSTGEDATNSAESFIDNISLEYRLDKSAARQLKVFYERDVRDPLEGQLSKAGAGLVMRKKSNKLGELFIFKRKKDEEKK